MLKRLPLCLLLLLLGVTHTSLSAESKGLAFLQSLAVPGLNQIRSHRNYGYAMLSAEVGIISGLLYLGEERELKQQEYFEYAYQHAHIQPRSYPDQYFRDLSRYNSSGFEAGGYNAQVRETAMQMYPNDTVQQQLYIDANAYPADYAWAWDSTEYRSAYSKVRVQAQDLRDYSKLALGVLIVNHLISGIDALRYNSSKVKTHTYLDLQNGHPRLNLCLEW